MKKPDCRNCKSQAQGEWDFSICAACDKIEKYRTYLEGKRKFKRGEPIKTLDELLNQTFVMWYGRTTHITVILNQQLAFVLDLLEKDCLRYAIRKENEK